MELIFYALVGMGFLIAISNWKAGLYAAVVLDILRDPIRKLIEGEPVLITVSVAFVWGAIFLGAIQQNRREVLAVLRIFPKLNIAARLLVVALIPGALLSIAAYPGGWRLAAIGAISYLGPLLGFAIGFALAGDQRELYRWITFYTIANSIAMFGTLAENFGADWGILGGLADFEWIRYRPGVIIRLMSGIYRSPDIMGIHAAHICMFSALLAIRPRSQSRWLWITLAAWGVICLLLGGRRKSIGMPVLFFSCFYLISVWRKSIDAARTARLVVAGVLILGIAYMLNREADIPDEHFDYASTVFTEGAERSQEIIGRSVLGTLHQAGVLGSGLGTATQGREHVMGQSSPRAWQEDGGSRLFMELGVFGVLLVFLAGLLFAQSYIAALRLLPPRHPLLMLQIGVTAVILANLGSFAISHQQYSSDPSTGMMICMFVGFVLSCPLARELGWFDLHSGGKKR
jgi:EamA domain-containing membrane protein RarD